MALSLEGRDTARRDGRKTLIATVLALYTLSTLSTFVFASAIYLYAAMLVDATMTASEILMVVSVSESLPQTKVVTVDDMNRRLAYRQYICLSTSLWLDVSRKLALFIRNKMSYAPPVLPLHDLWLYHG